MSASAPASPYHAANVGASTSTSKARAAGLSGYATPALTASAGTTPDILTRVVTPQDELPEFDLDLGDAALPLDHDDPDLTESNLAQKQKQASAEAEVAAETVPECWGHRGASATYRQFFLLPYL